MSNEEYDIAEYLKEKEFAKKFGNYLTNEPFIITSDMAKQDLAFKQAKEDGTKVELGAKPIKVDHVALLIANTQYYDRDQ